MVTTFLYLFVFSSWGMGLFAALVALSMKLQEHGVRMKSLTVELESDSMEIASKKMFLDKINGLSGASRSRELPDELKKLMENSPGHPEVNEIDNDDEVYGVVFPAHQYPPAMEADDNDNN
jgi:hypothetical protein